ncbi:MAG TPA: O-antigen ligase family protein [Flavobacteriales bacterium]
MKGSAAFRYVHLGALALAVVALPWSEFLLSNALILLGVNWLAEGFAQRDLGGRFRRAFRDPACAVWLSFFGLHLLGLLWTTDLKWGTDLCRILLPVPILGLVLGSSPRLSTTELRNLLLLGAWSVVGSTLVCLLLRREALTTGDYRSLSLFISHIRLALMLCFAAATFVYHWPVRALLRAAHAAAVLWILVFLLLMGSVTGVVIGGALLGWAFFRYAKRWSPAVRAVLVALPIAIVATIIVALFLLPEPRTERLDALEPRSAGGEPYYHDREKPQLENGYFVWVNIADGELERGWNRRSMVPYRGLDAQGLPLRTALVRYLTSMGLRKDSLGLAQLREADVRRIEQGITSVRTGRVTTLQTRLEQLRYEWEAYLSNGATSGHSTTMRLVFLRTGLDIARANLLLGTGTGDTQMAFNAAYERDPQGLEPRWWLRAHDQYLTWCISFGVPGLLWCLFAWWWPAWRLRAARQPLFVAWAIIAALSGLAEDTLETQMGATFAALPYALLVFAAPLMPRSKP